MKKISPLPHNPDFIEIEKKWLDHWYSKGVVKKYLAKNTKAKEHFSFLDGPITANNPMGVHHAWGRTYKDIWQRFHTMLGKKQRYQNGFDCQGLWVEVEVEKELGLKSKRDIENLVSGDTFASIARFVNLCKERVLKFSKIQTEQSKRLGYFMDWDNSYYTMSPENNYTIWHYLKRCHEKGWLYKGRDSVPWCPRCGTAISQHEILTEEYKEITHKTIVFKLPIAGEEHTYLLAWTTTPWTIPGNAALAVDPKLTYWKLRNELGETVILVDPSLETKDNEANHNLTLISKIYFPDEWSKVGEIKGSELVNLRYESPYAAFPAVQKAYGSYEPKVIATNSLILPIDPKEGTGIVHIAPGAGSEDFQLGTKYGVPAIEEIDENGVFLDGFGLFSGMSVREASQHIIDDLVSRKIAYKVIDYTHRYPTCWRCKSELIWRVVNEWYIAMDKKDLEGTKGKTYRKQMKDVAKNIHWIPDWGLDRELDWLSNMHDWLISKKRYWGLALPIYECSKCNTFEVIGSYEELRERAVEGWKKFDGNTPHRPWVDQVKIKCVHCAQIISRIPDVGNPWLDAGIVPYSTLHYLADKSYWQEWFPADFVTEAFPGQFKNWFYALIAMSTVLTYKPPFKNLLGHAQVRDEKGQEMHKSKGNAIEFNEAADKIGSDIMRWMYARENPQLNVNFGFKTGDEIRRRWYLTFWNTAKFFSEHAAISGWDPGESELTREAMSVLDKWILAELTDVVETVTKVLQSYDVMTATHRLEQLVIDYSTWYIRRSRDRVGSGARDKSDRMTCLNVQYVVLTTLCRLLAPLTPFISEEIWMHVIQGESVHLTSWPEVISAHKDRVLQNEMRLAREVVEMGHAIRKTSRVKVRQPLAILRYWFKDTNAGLQPGIEVLIREELNVKEIKHVDDLEQYLNKGKMVQLTKEAESVGMIGIVLDLRLSKELLDEGEARELIRAIQIARKEAGTHLNQEIEVILPAWPSSFEAEIRKRTLAKRLVKGDLLKVVPL